MKHLIIGAHLRREDIEPVAEVLEVAPLFLSALALPDDQPLGDRDLLLRTARVRSALLERATFVAIRYGFAARSQVEAAGKVAPHTSRWESLLREHRDDVEMTLKIAAVTSRPRPSRSQFSSGSGYLKALHDSRQSADVDPDFRAAVDARLTSAARAHRWIHRDDRTLELAMLVPRSAQITLREAGEKLKTDFPSVPFLLSGPWPLEVFADADHE